MDEVSIDLISKSLNLSGWLNVQDILHTMYITHQFKTKFQKPIDPLYIEHHGVSKKSHQKRRFIEP